jgi:uncharacterized protein
MVMADLRKSDGTVVTSDVEMADTLLKQVVGLMFRKSIPPGYAMIFDLRREQYVSIHMMFVFFPIDIVYLDRDRRIVDVKRRLRPWTGMAVPGKPARYAIEMPAGAAEDHGLEEGETLDWRAADSIPGEG